MIYNALAMAQVMRDLKLSRRNLERLVHKRLRNVLVSAYLHVPYYQKIMREAGYDPTMEYGGPEDLRKLPITTKEVVKKKGVKDFTRRGSDLSRFLTRSTSGSTGSPLKVYRSPYEQSLKIAKWLRVLFVNGYSIRDRVMSFTEPSLLSESRSILQRLGIFRRSAVDFTLNSTILLDTFLREKPDVLQGNCCYLDLVALELKERGVRANDLKLLISTGEMISESSRKLWSDVYGVEVVESYASVEMGVMAYGTPDRDGLHLCEDLTFLEFLDDEGQPVPAGEPGRVVVTDLVGRFMPFIRYEQGDKAVYWEVKDADGRDVRRIIKVVGREDDYAILPDGSRWAHENFDEEIGEYTDIYQYRIIQKRSNLFQIQIVSDRSYFEAVHNNLLESLQNRFPPDVNFEIELVGRLDPDPDGKLRKLICMVQ